jgi:signal recognition particle subunit SRP19
MVAFQIQLQKPDNVPRPPYKLPPTGPTETTSATPKPTKGKQPAPKPKQPAAVPPKPSGRRLPIPPDPQPSLSARLSAYSPAISSGVLIETLKAGMNAQEGAPGTAPGAPGVGGVGKGKRKVVRVRG